MLKYFIPLAAAALLLFLAGCVGEEKPSVITGGQGTLAGLVVTPEPQTIGIETDDVFYLDWEPGYEPPPELTISLKSVDPDNSTWPVLTVLTDLDPANPGHYRLEPSYYLPTETVLLLTVSGGGERQRAMYLTESDSIFSATTRRLPGGQAEHTIKTK
ncbi:MAG: hypothetical protein ACYDCO_08585 [Armatimonadota bacterium]